MKRPKKQPQPPAAADKRQAHTADQLRAAVTVAALAAATALDLAKGSRKFPELAAWGPLRRGLHELVRAVDRDVLVLRLLEEVQGRAVAEQEAGLNR